MTLCTVSLMSCRSPLVRVIRSIDNFDALTFLRNLFWSARCWCFNCVDVVCGFVPPPLLPLLPSHVKATFVPCSPSRLPPVLLLLRYFPTQFPSV